MTVPSAATSLAAVVVAVLSTGPLVAQRYVRVHDSRGLLAAAPRLTAGQTLELAPGIYDFRSLRLIGLAGRAGAPITIRSQPGGRAVLRGVPGENVINIKDCAWLRLEDLEVTCTGQSGGGDGLKIVADSTNHDITVEGCRFHHLPGNGVSSQAALLERLSLIACEIDHVGGCGVYLGYPSNPPRLAIGTRIVDCYLHDIADPQEATQYGIQIKPLSYGSVIENNVLHHVGGHDRAAIAVYYPDGAGRVPPERWNVIRGNVMWALPNEGIYVVNGAIVENNVIVDARVGIGVSEYAGSRIDNLRIVHNSVYRCRSAAMNLGGWWKADGSCTLANNLIVQDDGRLPAIAGTSRGFGGARVAGNAVHGSVPNGSGLAAVAAPSELLRAAGAGVLPTALDLRPRAGSALVGAGSTAFMLEQDVDGNPRTSATLAPGAYGAGGLPSTGLRAAFRPPTGALVPRAVHLRPGGRADWTIRGGHPNAFYALFVSRIVGSDGVMPVRADTWTDMLVTAGAPTVAGYLGRLDAAGTAHARLSVPTTPGFTVPLTLYHVALWFHPTGIGQSDVVRATIRP